MRRRLASKAVQVNRTPETQSRSLATGLRLPSRSVMGLDQHHVQILVREQLRHIADSGQRTRIEALLVTPHCVFLDWDYGEPGEQYPGWMVIEHAKSDTGIAYCEHGFGPECPWGLVGLQPSDRSMGMDSGWFRTLEEAFGDSMFGDPPHAVDDES